MYKIISSNNIPKCCHFSVNIDGSFSPTHEEECCKGWRDCSVCSKYGDTQWAIYRDINNYDKFSKYISQMIKLGWKCQGGVCFGDYHIIQAMVYENYDKLCDIK